jgi:hypothetical protein
MLNDETKKKKLISKDKNKKTLESTQVNLLSIIPES